MSYPATWRVTGIDASADRNDAVETVDHFRDLFEAPAKGELGSSGVLDEDCQAAGGEIQSLRRRSNCRGGAKQPLLTICPAKRPGMQYQIVRAQGQSPFYFAAKSLHRFVQEQFIRAGQIHKIVCVNHQRFQVVSRPQAVHLVALWDPKFVRRPLARAGREDLQRIAAQPIGAFGGILHTSCRRCMDADAARGQAGWPFRSGSVQNVAFNHHRNSFEFRDSSFKSWGGRLPPIEKSLLHLRCRWDER